MPSLTTSILAGADDFFGSLLGGDAPFHGAQRIGVQAGRDQPGVQGVGPGGPPLVDALGVVEGGVGAQGVELMPGQVVAGGQAQRGVGCVPALGEVIGAAASSLGGADPAPGGQRR